MLSYSAGLNANTGPLRKWRGTWLVALLLVALPLAFGALNYLVPKVPNGVQGTTVRMGWYLRSGQWQADARTLVAALQFLMDPDPMSPAWTYPPGIQPMAVSQSESNPPSPRQMKAGIIWVTNGCLPHRIESSPT